MDICFALFRARQHGVADQNDANTKMRAVSVVNIVSIIYTRAYVVLELVVQFSFVPLLLVLVSIISIVIASIVISVILLVLFIPVPM